MNMGETKLYSWFLGPKAENADLLERLILEALRDCVFWRRNFHPEDDIIITEKCKREDTFQDSLALVRQEFLALLANLKRDIPFYSPRYIGHLVIEALGLGKQQIKMIPVDSHFRTDVGALRNILLRCADERRPVLAVVSVLGTTEEGAVDQIHRLVELQAEMRRRGLEFYHHCDAAWGGYTRTLFYAGKGKPVGTPSAIREITQTWPSDEVFQSFSAIHRADSITIDPHKLGYERTGVVLSFGPGACAGTCARGNHPENPHPAARHKYLLLRG